MEARKTVKSNELTSEEDYALSRLLLSPLRVNRDSPYSIGAEYNGNLNIDYSKRLKNDARTKEETTLLSGIGGERESLRSG